MSVRFYGKASEKTAGVAGGGRRVMVGTPIEVVKEGDKEVGMVVKAMDGTMYFLKGAEAFRDRPSFEERLVASKFFKGKPTTIYSSLLKQSTNPNHKVRLKDDMVQFETYMPASGVPAKTRAVGKHGELGVLEISNLVVFARGARVEKDEDSPEDSKEFPADLIYEGYGRIAQFNDRVTLEVYDPVRVASSEDDIRAAVEAVSATKNLRLRLVDPATGERLADANFHPRMTEEEKANDVAALLSAAGSISDIRIMPYMSTLLGEQFLAPRNNGKPSRFDDMLKTMQNFYKGRPMPFNVEERRGTDWCVPMIVSRTQYDKDGVITPGAIHCIVPAHGDAIQLRELHMTPEQRAAASLNAPAQDQQPEPASPQAEAPATQADEFEDEFGLG